MNKGFPADAVVCSCCLCLFVSEPGPRVRRDRPMEGLEKGTMLTRASGIEGGSTMRNELTGVLCVRVSVCDVQTL